MRYKSKRKKSKNTFKKYKDNKILCKSHYCKVKIKINKNVINDFKDTLKTIANFNLDFPDYLIFINDKLNIGSENNNIELDILSRTQISLTHQYKDHVVYQSVYNEIIDNYIKSLQFYMNTYNRLTGSDIKIDFKLKFTVDKEIFKVDLLFIHPCLIFGKNSAFARAIRSAMRTVPDYLLIGSDGNKVYKDPENLAELPHFNYDEYKINIYHSLYGFNNEKEFFNKENDDRYEINYLFKAINFYLQNISVSHGKVYDICDINFIKDTKSFEEIIVLASMSNI